MINRLKYLRTIGHGELSFRRIIEAGRRRVCNVPHYCSWRWTRAGRMQSERLNRFRGVHDGCRCVILANGPSLNSTPLHLLEGEITIGLNRVHLLEDRFGLTPSYVVVSDVISQLQYIPDQLAAIPVPKFVNWNGRHHVKGEKFYYFKTTFHPRFSTNFAKAVYGGHSVTFAALQLAYFMGFTRVILVGKDHSYAASGVPTAPVISTGRERNHFAPGYYDPGELWRVPDYKGEELAYRMARDVFAAEGRRVMDATVGGRLAVFEKVDLAMALSA